MYYIYCYSLDKVPIYIGKGSGDRWKLSFHKNKDNKELWNIIKKRENDIVIDILFIHEDEALVLQKEIDIISSWGRKNLSTGTLLNKKNGGEGQRNFSHSEKTKKQMSQTRKGVKHSKEHIENRTKSLRGQTRTLRQRERIRNNTPNLKLNLKRANDIRRLYKTGKYTFANLAKIYKVGSGSISEIINNKSWINLTNDSNT